MRCGAGIEARQVDELFINIDPIQAGGRLTPDAMKAVIAYGDGYSVCDNCRKPNRLDYISKPPIAEFHKDVAAWLNMDAVRTVPGARRGFQAVAHTYVHKGDPVLLTSLSHYTEFLAVEEAGGIAREIPVDSNHMVTPEATAAKIEEVKREFGRPPVLAFIDHVDYQYGNVHDVKAVTKVLRNMISRFCITGLIRLGSCRLMARPWVSISLSGQDIRVWQLQLLPVFLRRLPSGQQRSSAPRQLSGM